MSENRLVLSYDPELTIPRPIETRGLPPLLVSIKQASTLLSFGRDTIDDMCRRGELRTVRRGKAVRIVYSSIVEWIDGQQTGQR